MRNKILLSSAVVATLLAFPVLISAQDEPPAPGPDKISPTDAAPSIPDGAAGVGAFACPNGGALLISQPPNQSNGIFADSDCALCGTGEQSIADDFVVVSATDVAQLVFWGGYFPGNQFPTPPDPINVIFRQDAAGLPGAVIDSQNLVPTSATLTGTMLFDVDEIMYEVNLNPVALPAGTFWMEIFTNSVGNSDSFFWETGNLDPANGRDGTAFDTETPGVTWTATPAQNFAFALCETRELESRATFAVTKDFTDENSEGVEVTISCNTGLPLEQSKVITEGESVEFVVVDFDDGEMDCEVTEDVPAGYDPEYFDGTATSSASCEFLDVAFESEFSCQITNTPAPVDVVIHKEWVFEGSSDPQGIDQRYDLTLWCDAEIVDGFNFGQLQEAPAGAGPFCGPIILAGQDGPQGFADWCKPFFGEGEETFIAEVIPEFPDSRCFVIERVFDSAVEVDNGCRNITVSAGNGAECTITNTVFFEGIPTLNQYGLALLALLMLGVGLIGFRRFV